jgi:hypothetical protein
MVCRDGDDSGGEEAVAAPEDSVACEDDEEGGDVEEDGFAGAEEEAIEADREFGGRELVRVHRAVSEGRAEARPVVPTVQIGGGCEKDEEEKGGRQGFADAANADRDEDDR